MIPIPGNPGLAAVTDALDRMTAEIARYREARVEAAAIAVAAKYRTGFEQLTIVQTVGGGPPKYIDLGRGHTIHFVPGPIVPGVPDILVAFDSSKPDVRIYLWVP